MRWLKVGIVAFISSIIFSVPTWALDVESYSPPPVLKDSPVIITAYSRSTTVLDYVQLFNSSDEPVNIDGWKLQVVTDAGAIVPLVELNGWLAPKNYVVAASSAAVDGADFVYDMSTNSANISTIQLVPTAVAMMAAHEVKTSVDSMYQRKISTSTGNYLSTFEKTSEPLLYGGGFYTYSSITSLQVSEVLPNPKNCSPTDESLDCLDYIKLYNPSDEPIDLSAFRLRVGYKGQTATSSNTYMLVGMIKPGHYMSITQDASGKQISVTNSGAFVWLEDAYGILRYDSTIQEYPDASSSTHEGQAWAYDVSDGAWKWTSQPTPGDAPSIFPAPVVVAAKTSVKAYVPCLPGQYRSPETNRCRSLATAESASLKPCPAGQYRNAETNRCRKVETASSTLQPCQEGYERNPETNRCRKIQQTLTGGDYKVEPIANAGTAFAGWWALGGVGTLAAGYGAWEWRREVTGGVRKLGQFFTSGK